MADSSLTKRALAAAMKSLMSEQPFRKISVGDVCETCGMNRKSFYYHFIDKYDLVNWIYYTEVMEIAARQRLDDPWELLRAVCVYLHENRRFYANALSMTGQNAFPEYFAAMLKPLISLQIPGAPEEELHGFAEDFFSDALVLSVRRWLVQTPEMPPDTYVTLLRRTITGR